MKELGRLLNRKTILLILAAACICVVAVFAGDFSDCGIDNYKIKVRDLQRNTRKSLIILMDIQKVLKQLLQMPRI